jgi:hypothetical protein
MRANTTRWVVCRLPAARALRQGASLWIKTSRSRNHALKPSLVWGRDPQNLSASVIRFRISGHQLAVLGVPSFTIRFQFPQDFPR